MSLHQKVSDIVNNFLGLFQINMNFFGQVNILKIRINNKTIRKNQCGKP